MAGINFIRRWVMSQMKKTSDDGIMITLPDKNKVDLNVRITMDRLISNGIDPDQITSPQQVENALNMINSRMVNRAIPADSAEGREITEKLFGKQKAPVFDMEGNRISEGSGIMGGKSLKNLMDSGQVTKGARGMNKSKKVQDREMFQAANERLTSDVDTIVKNIKRLSPMDAMKEANLVIGRKGYYKNLSPEESKKILKDTEDHIFERDIPETEDFAAGGRAGLRFGGDTMGGRNDRSKSSSGPDRSRVSDRQQANHDRAMSNRSNDGPSFRDKVRSVVTNPVVQTLGGALLTGGINLAVPGALDKLNKARMIKNAIDYAKYIAPDKAIEDELENIQTTGGISPSMLRNSPYKNIAPRSMAAGGVAGLLGERPRYQTGGDVAFDASDASVYGSSAITVTPETVADAFGNQVQQEMGNTYNPPLIEDVIEEKSVVEDTKKEEVMQRPSGPDFLKQPNDPSMYHDSGVMKRPGPAIPDGAFGISKKDIDPIMQGFQESEFRKNANMMQQDSVNFKYNGKDMMMNGSMAGAFQQYLDSIGKGDLMERKKNQMPLLPPDRPITESPFPGTGASTPPFGNLMGGYKSFASERYGDGPFRSTADVRSYRLPDGTVQQGSSTSMGRINEYLKSIGQPPATDVNSVSPLMQAGLADGGIARAGFAGGGMGRRGFLKLLAGAGAGIAGLKSGLVNILGKGTGKEVAKEVVQQSTSTPPPYFFKLAEKIKMLGDDATATTDRTISKSLKSKDGTADYILEEDMVTGDTIIKKINKEGDEMITDIEIMELRKGEVVKGKDGRPVKTPDSYEEVTEANSRIEGDVFNDPYYTDGINIDDIMKEVGEQAPSIKKASGGVARLLGE